MLNYLRRLINNPHYKLNPKQEAEIELTTQDIRADDAIVKIPKVRRKRRNGKAKIRRDQVSEENLHPEI